MAPQDETVDDRRVTLLRFYARDVPGFAPDGEHAGTAAAAFMGAYHELPKLALDRRGRDAPPVEEASIRTSIAYLAERDDCAEFGLAALHRILYGFPDSELIEDNLRRDIEDEAADFMYWLDEPGEESMCFWTENHQILFHSNQLLAGQRLPDRTFANGKSGRWHRKQGRRRTKRWLDWRLRFGFSEWHSNAYYQEDVIALANLVDFADDPTIRSKANDVLDLLCFHLAVTSYAGIFGTPHGRTYARYLLDPPSEPVAPIRYLYLGQGSFRAAGMTRVGPVIAASGYERPSILEDIAAHEPEELVARERHSLDVEEARDVGVDPDDTGDFPFFLGAQTYNHRDVVETARDAVPEKHYLSAHIEEAYEYYHRQEERAGTWRRLTYEPDPNSQAMTRADVYTYRTPAYMLSCVQDYRPGKAGFQQHVWQATLGAQAPVYTTHPGRETMDGRPNYWHGNGILPRVAAHRNVLFCAYRTGSDRAHPEYTHAFVPRHVFDEYREADGWVFGCVGGGYIALRSARPTEWRDPEWGPNDEASEYVRRGVDVQGDLPAYDIVAAGGDTVWTCELGNKTQYGSFEDFVDAVADANLDEDPTAVTYESPLHGRVSFGWDRDLTVADEMIDVAHSHRIDTPYCTAEFGEPGTEIEYDGRTLVLDSTRESI